MPDSELSYAVSGCAMKVHNELGPGLREKPYENAMIIALQEENLDPIQQPRFPILYQNTPVGDCVPDILLSDQLIIEAKAIETIGESELAQMLNYLRISKISLGLIINFKPSKLQWKRVVKSGQ